MEIRFERPTAADAPMLIEVQVRAFHDDVRIYPGVEFGGPPGYDSVEVMLRDMTTMLCYKIMHNERIIGGITIFDHGDGHFHLDRLFIDPDYHNKGVGTRAMQFIEMTHQGRLWTLDTPTYATRNHHFYEKLGYVRAGEKVLDIPLICYEKRL